MAVSKLDKTVNVVHAILRVFDVKGGTVLGAFTVLMMCLCAYAVIKGKDVPGGVTSAYGIVVGVYGVSKTVKELNS